MRYRDFTETCTYELENLCPSVVQIAAPQLSRFWRWPSFNAVPPLSDWHLLQSVSYCFCHVADLLKISSISFLKLSKSGTTSLPLKALSIRTMLGLITLLTVSFSIKLRFDEERYHLLFQSFKTYFWNWQKSSLIFSMLSWSKLLVGHPSTPSTLHSTYML